MCLYVLESQMNGQVLEAGMFCVFCNREKKDG